MIILTVALAIVIAFQLVIIFGILTTVAEPIPTVQVISVKTEKRSFEEVIQTADRYAYGMKQTETKKYSHDVTTVLLIKNGELATKEFNGKWDLAEVKRLETQNDRAN